MEFEKFLFSDGLRQGLITAGLNHAMHEIAGGLFNDPGDPKRKKARVRNTKEAADNLGNVAGGYYGGIQWAIAGSSFGLPFGPAGVVIGGVMGGITGGLGGGYIGSNIGTSAVNYYHGR